MKSGNFFSKGQPEKSAGKISNKKHYEKIVAHIKAKKVRMRLRRYSSVLKRISNDYCRSLGQSIARAPMPNEENLENLFDWSKKDSRKARELELKSRLDVLEEMHKVVNMLLIDGVKEPTVKEMIEAIERLS